MMRRATLRVLPKVVFWLVVAAIVVVMVYLIWYVIYSLMHSPTTV